MLEFMWASTLPRKQGSCCCFVPWLVQRVQTTLMEYLDLTGEKWVASFLYPPLSLHYPFRCWDADQKKEDLGGFIMA